MPEHKGKTVVPGTNRTNFVCRPGFQDHIYKTVHGVELPVRIWPANRPKNGDEKSKTPWFIWIHGGGWQSGNPYAIDPPMQAAFGDSFHIISIAYRLIPQVGLAEMVQDCKDAFAWCQSHLPSILPSIDIDRYFVGGDSAGGTMASLMGHMLEPRPKVVLDIYGVMDFTNFKLESQFTSTTASGQPSENDEKLGKLLEDRNPKNAMYARPPRWLINLPLQTFREFWGLPDLEIDKDAAQTECDLYDYTSSHHLRFALLFRKENIQSPEEWTNALKSYSSLFLLDPKKGYPATFILHGTGDDVVPVSQGYDFEKKLKEIGVDVEVCYPEGEGHGFDMRLNGPEDEGYEEFIGPIIRFVDKHL